MSDLGDERAVLAHIDYPIRYWPVAAGQYSPQRFEDEYRCVLKALADTGRALEVNTKGGVLPRKSSDGGEMKVAKPWRSGATRIRPKP